MQMKVTVQCCEASVVLNILSYGTLLIDKPLMIHQTSTLTNYFTLHSLKEMEIIRYKTIGNKKKLQYRSGHTEPH